MVSCETRFFFCCFCGTVCLVQLLILNAYMHHSPFNTYWRVCVVLCYAVLWLETSHYIAVQQQEAIESMRRTVHLNGKHIASCECNPFSVLFRITIHFRHLFVYRNETNEFFWNLESSKEGKPLINWREKKKKKKHLNWSHWHPPTNRCWNVLYDWQTFPFLFQKWTIMLIIQTIFASLQLTIIIIWPNRWGNVFVKITWSKPIRRTLFRLVLETVCHDVAIYIVNTVRGRDK